MVQEKKDSLSLKKNSRKYLKEASYNIPGDYLKTVSQ